ncbi:hypothetical protein HDU91_004577, partial [Kappamyces sp. JEL0680]
MLTTTTDAYLTFPFSFVSLLVTAAVVNGSLRHTAFSRSRHLLLYLSISTVFQLLGLTGITLSSFTTTADLLGYNLVNFANLGADIAGFFILRINLEILGLYSVLVPNVLNKRWISTL